MQRPVGTVGEGDTPLAWFQRLPFVTKYILLGTVLISGACTFGALSLADVAFIPPFITKRFQLWRFITPFFFAGSFSFNFLMHIMALYENCSRYERMPFNTGAGGTSADFVWMLCLAACVFPILGYFFELPFFSESLLFMIMYVWSRREPAGVLNIFGFKFQALYLPWVYLAIRLLMGAPILGPLYGIGVGHLYYFLADVLPLSHNIDLIHTPLFVTNFVSHWSGVTPPTGPNRAAAGPANPNAFGGHNWGRGRTLGAN